MRFRSKSLQNRHLPDPFCQRRSKRRGRVITVLEGSCLVSTVSRPRTVYTERTYSRPHWGRTLIDTEVYQSSSEL